MPINIADSILSGGADEAVAVLHEDRVVTYGALRRDVVRLAVGLLASGHVKGDRIGLWSENSVFFVTAYLGIIRAGLVAVPFQTEVSEEAFSQIVANAGIREVWVSRLFVKRVQPWAEKAGVALRTQSDVQGLPNRAAAPLPEIDPSRDLAALMFTSGSTRSPRGVMVSHRNIECNTRDILAYTGLTAEDRALVVLPFYYCFGLSLLHTHLMAGASLVLNNDFMYPETVVQDLVQKECTGLAGVPSTYQILLRKSRFREVAFAKLRWLQQAGGKLPNPYIAEILQAFPRVRFFLMYGQTEATARLSYLPPERLADKLGSIGRGMPSAALKVLKPDGTPVAPGSEETGEIVAEGENIALGYWNDPIETSKYFRNGRLYTGDIARVDSDGFVYVVERERDFIKSGGNRVSAKEVEDILAERPEVVEVAAVGVPHEVFGEAVAAFVVLTRDAEISPTALRNHCRSRLPPFKAPQGVFVLRNMPHNGAGKILKPKLREMALAALAAKPGA